MHTLILGLDAFDPNIFERLHDRGRLPTLGKYADSGGYARFGVTNPPQSEVSWTSIATGLNPGAHGLFDFVHRDPATYRVHASLLPTKKGLAGTQFVRPYNARTLFDHAVDRGYPATTLWWPATFPAQAQNPVNTLPGLGTPDLLGRLGVGTFFTDDPDLNATENKIPIEHLTQKSNDHYTGALHGPARKKLLGGMETTTAGFHLEQTGDDTAALTIDGRRIELRLGQWSPILELSFKIGLIFSVKALTRFILTQLEPHVRLYALPLQIHPGHSPWPYGASGGFVKDTWDNCGPFLTLGWPQDTTALEEGYIDDDHFLALCHDILAARERVLMHHIDHFHEGALASVFDTLDRVQHMFWRQRPDIVEDWYVRLDQLVARVQERLAQRRLQEEVRLVIVSDHGFSDFHHKVHLNHWLEEAGYLVTTDHQPLDSSANSSNSSNSWQKNTRRHSLSDVNWSQTRAYALGLNGIYLNLAGREGQGAVSPADRDRLVRDLCRALQQWQGPDGQPVVQEALPRDQAFQGPFAEHGPDIVVGYAPGYRASQDTGLGKWPAQTIVPNNDHWAADHCISAAAVPGVLFANQDRLRDHPSPTYRDIPAITIDAAPDSSGSAPPPPPMAGEDEQAIEERLKGLGYL